MFIFVCASLLGVFDCLFVNTKYVQTDIVQMLHYDITYFYCDDKPYTFHNWSLAAFPLHPELRKTKIAQLKTSNENTYILKSLWN